MIVTKKIPNINKSFSYNDYKKIVFELAEKKSSSSELTEERIGATLINAQRIKRIDKQCEINSELSNQIKSISEIHTWIVISESWCGDGAQCIPVIAKMAEQNSNIDLKLVFRDENIDLIDSFLTNGARAVPKLICINNNTNTVIGTWGPRPKSIQAMVSDFKKNNPDVTHDDFVKNLHLWYAKDKTNAIQEEFSEIIQEWKFINNTK